MRKNYVGMTLLFITTSFLAGPARSQPCGQITSDQVDAMRESVMAVTLALAPHGDGLLNELSLLLKARRYSASQADKLLDEQWHVHVIEDQLDAVYASLDTAWKIATLKEHIAETQPSPSSYALGVFTRQLQSTRKLSERSTIYIAKMLGRFTRPAIALDATRARDTLNSISASLSSCS
jgi:hypothetical protein